MRISRFVTVVQRRMLAADESVFPTLEPLFSIETHMAMEERIRLAHIAMQMPENFVACEVGSYLGASTCFLAVAARLKKGMIHCVDSWDNRAMGAELPRDTYDEFRRNTEPFREHIVEHRGESAAMAGAVPAGIDLLFIDGDHSYPGARLDLFSYGPKLKPDGILLLHDFDYPTIQRACTEYLATHPARKLGVVHTLQAFQMLAACPAHTFSV